MKTAITVLLATMAGTLAYGLQEPTPLRDVALKASVIVNAKGLYEYSYSATNPVKNDAEIKRLRIFLPRDNATDAVLPRDGLTHCGKYHKNLSEENFAKAPMVPVGSSSPAGWSCGYAQLRGYSDGAYGWASGSGPRIKPGNSLGGFVLRSRGLPAIRDVLAQPNIDHENLPPEYFENAEKTTALENKIKWLGKTVGPKAPPKVFNASAFITYLTAIKDQSVMQSWLTNEPAKELTEKLTQAANKVEACKVSSAKEAVRGFVEEVRETWEQEQRELKEESKERKDNDRDKKRERQPKITSEGYALLYFNGNYLLTQIENKTNLNCPPERDGDHDKDDDKKKDH